MRCEIFSNSIRRYLYKCSFHLITLNIMLVLFEMQVFVCAVCPYFLGLYLKTLESENLWNVFFQLLCGARIIIIFGFWENRCMFSLFINYMLRKVTIMLVFILF